MSNVVTMYPEPGRAERLIETASEGGIEITVQFYANHESTLLFTLFNATAPSTEAMAAMTEMASRFRANADFRDSVERFCIQLGAAVHYVGDEPWKFRALTPAETAALYASEPRMNS